LANQIEAAWDSSASVVECMIGIMTCSQAAALVSERYKVMKIAEPVRPRIAIPDRSLLKKVFMF
jgi:hypothetical protein